MPDAKISISFHEIAMVVETLKQIDVRGYESMNRLVATVVFFEKYLSVGQFDTDADAIMKELEKRGEMNNGR